MKERRDYGSGTFRTLKNGTIEYTINYGTDAYGRRLRKPFYGKNQADCRRQARTFLKDIGSQKTAVSDYTLGQWLDRWLKSYRGKRIPAGEKQIQQSTLDEYQRYADRVKKYKISKVILINIKPIMLSDFFKDDLSKYSYTVIKKTRFLLNAAFEAAIENDLCYKNPMRTASIPQKAPGGKKDFPDDVVKVITEYALLDKVFGVCALLLLHAGLRSEELRAIGTADIAGQLVTVNKAIKETGDLGTTKNRKPRIVVLGKDIAATINKLLNGTNQRYILGGDHYVNKDKLRTEYNAFFRRLNAWCKQNGKPAIERLPPHCCRHTYSTRLRRDEVPLEIVSALLGHNELETTEGYTHLDHVEDLKKAVDKAYRKSKRKARGEEPMA